MTVDVLLVLEEMLPSIQAALDGRRLGSSVERAAEGLPATKRQTARLEGFTKAASSLNLEDDQEFARALTGALRIARRFSKAMSEAQTVAQLDELSDILRELTTAISTLEIAVRARWRRVIETQFLPFVAVGQVLSQIPNLRELADALADFGREAREATERRTAPEALANEIDRLRTTRDELDVRLQSLTGDAEIDGFLRAVTANTATLAIVSPAVVAWLSAHGALTAFSVGAVRV